MDGSRRFREPLVGAHGADHKVRFVFRRAGTGKLESIRAGYMNLVIPVDGLQDRANLVVPVVAPSQDSQFQINFGERSQQHRVEKRNSVSADRFETAAAMHRMAASGRQTRTDKSDPTVRSQPAWNMAPEAFSTNWDQKSERGRTRACAH